MMPHVSAEFLAKIDRFVRDGGVWICAPVTGTRGAEHTVPVDAGLGSIDALGGIETVFSFPVTGAGATGEAFGVTAPLAGWCSALRAVAPDTQVVGTMRCEQAPGLTFLTERKLGRGAVVVLGTLPDGDAGRELLAEVVKHYAARAGVTLSFQVTPGMVVCPRITVDGQSLWVVVNLDGKGGVLHLAAAARDALTGTAIPAGPFAIESYGWCALRF